MTISHKLRAGLVAAALIAVAVPARADYVVKQGDTNNTPITLCAKSSNGIQIVCHVLTDLTGAPIGLTSAAPFHVTLDSNGVTIAALPALPPGTNAIGSVSVTALPALAAGTATIGSLLNISGTISLPTGASTATLQSTGNGYLGTLATASATQATATKQDTGNTSLASIDGKATTNNSSLASIVTNTTGLASKLDTLHTDITGTATQSTAPGGTHTAVIGIEGAGGSANPVPVSGTVTTVSGTVINTTYRIAASAASTNAQNLSATPKKIYQIRFCNVSSSFRSVKLFNKATTPVPGTDTIKLSIPAPAGVCPAIDWNAGYTLDTGLGIAITAGAADSDATAVAAGDIAGLNIDTN